MKKIIVCCVLLAMCVGNAVAQCECKCSHCVKNVYYEMLVNNETYRFDGNEAYIAASQLQNASKAYFVNIDDGPVHVYKLKGKAYGVIVGSEKYVCQNGNVVQTDHLPDIRGELYSGGADKGFLLGYSNQQKRLLAIYE